MDSKKVLVTGGAGFIGSHVNKLLNTKDFETVVLDDLSTGSQESVVRGTFVQGDFGDQSLLKKLFTDYQFDAVFHFAAFTDVGESVRDPGRYYTNNVVKTISLLNSMVEHGVKNFIFSSSAAVYGITEKETVREADPTDPINPYGRTKLMVESILADYGRAYELKSCSLRYFNAAGGDPDGEIKNFKKKENNLIPIVLRSLLNNTPVTIFGTDYDTPDGTCVRDYIHVMDLADAHILAMKQLSGSTCYNLGNSRGCSVREAIAAAEKGTGRKVEIVEGPRRPGDPPILMADASKAERELGWKRRYPTIDTMIEHAWRSYQPD